MNCRSCDTIITEFFSLGQMPLVNYFLREDQFATEKKYLLSIGFCPQCYLIQLMEEISPEVLFRNYIYFSSNSSAFLNHSKELAEKFVKHFNLGFDSLVLEIASNDGAQLQYYKTLGVKVLGIDPAENIAKIANEKGIETIPKFFNYAFAKILKNEKKIQADLIFGANVLAHIPEIRDFIRGVKEVLKPKGTAVFEFPYVKGLMENKFDIIYHEHVFYYSLIALQNIFGKECLEIYDVEMTPMQGGSLLIFTSHAGNFPLTDLLKNMVEEEKRQGYNKLETYQKIGKNVGELKKEIISLLESIKKEGKTIIGYSAPAKGNILLNYFGIGKQYLDFIVDKSKAKQGLYTPGTHLLVHAIEKIDEIKPDYLLVLCWNIADEVIAMPELKNFKDCGGKCIIPIPKVIIL